MRSKAFDPNGYVIVREQDGTEFRNLNQFTTVDRNSAQEVIGSGGVLAGMNPLLQEELEHDINVGRANL